MAHTVKFSHIAAIAVLGPAALLATACSSGSSSGTSNSGSSSSTANTQSAVPSKQPTIAAEVPAAYRGTQVHVAMDASYAPNEFVNLSGDITGWDPALAKDVCAVLGLNCVINNVTFDDIIPGILQNPSRYQMAFSSFTPTAEREAAGIDFISYYKAGELWYTKVGGSRITADVDMCGLTGAVQAGTTVEADAWGFMGMNPGGSKIAGAANHCAAADKPDIKVLSFDSATQENAAVLSGRADFGWDDSPVVAYVVKQQPGKLTTTGVPCAVAPYGAAVARTSGLQKAVQGAIKYLIGNKYYGSILSSYGVQGGAITSAEVGINDNAQTGAACVPSS